MYQALFNFVCYILKIVNYLGIIFCLNIIFIIFGENIFFFYFLMKNKFFLKKSESPIRQTTYPNLFCTLSCTLLAPPESESHSHHPKSA
jgi:hypothetical protein